MNSRGYEATLRAVPEYPKAFARAFPGVTVDKEATFMPGMLEGALLIYTELSTNPSAAGQLRIWGAAATLIIIVMVFQLLASLISRFSAISK